MVSFIGIQASLLALLSQLSPVSSNVATPAMNHPYHQEAPLRQVVARLSTVFSEVWDVPKDSAIGGLDDVAPSTTMEPTAFWPPTPATQHQTSPTHHSEESANELSMDSFHHVPLQVCQQSVDLCTRFTQTLWNHTETTLAQWKNWTIITDVFETLAEIQQKMVDRLNDPTTLPALPREVFNRWMEIIWNHTQTTFDRLNDPTTFVVTHILSSLQSATTTIPEPLYNTTSPWMPWMDPRYEEYGSLESIDACDLHKFHLGFPYGIFAQRFWDSPHVPICMPAETISCSTSLFKSPIRFLVDYYSSGKPNQQSVITREELDEAIAQWLDDEIDAILDSVQDTILDVISIGNILLKNIFLRIMSIGVFAMWCCFGAVGALFLLPCVIIWVNYALCFLKKFLSGNRDTTNDSVPTSALRNKPKRRRKKKNQRRRKRKNQRKKRTHRK